MKYLFLLLASIIIFSCSNPKSTLEDEWEVNSRRFTNSYIMEKTSTSYWDDVRIQVDRKTSQSEILIVSDRDCEYKVLVHFVNDANGVDSTQTFNFIVSNNRPNKTPIVVSSNKKYIINTICNLNSSQTAFAVYAIK